MSAIFNRIPLRALAGLVPLVLVAVGVAPLATAQTAPKAKVAFRPITNDDIAAFKLPASAQKSGGLSTVGIGRPVYLEALLDKTIPTAEITGVTWDFTGKPATSNATFGDSPLDIGVPIYEPSDRAAFQIASRKLLSPDVAGEYFIKARITTAKNGTIEMSFLVTAGTYVGSQTCTGCHDGGSQPPWNMASSWSKTGHANLFKEAMNGVASDHYSESCISCHTVGYDKAPQAINGGFDDVAKALNWTFPTPAAGVYDAMPDALKNVGGIQCENCHGPGSQHIKGASPLLISVSNDSGVCGQCHGALTHHSKTGEWLNSKHAVTTTDPSGAGREGCVGCHTATGFIDRVSGATTVRTAYNAINCQTCHEPHGQTTPADAKNILRTVKEVTLQDGTVVTDGGKGALCMNCHMSRRNAAQYVDSTPPSSHWGPHYGTQTDMLEGVNGYTYGQSMPTSAHAFVVEDTCVTCHMQTVAAGAKEQTHVGGHTFMVASAADASGARMELIDACKSCHGRSVTSLNFALLDYDGDGTVEGVQTEVQHLLDQLSALLPPDAKAKDALAIDSTWTQQQLRAAYNWNFVKSDGSYGIHNMAYTVALLKASITDLKSTPAK